MYVLKLGVGSKEEKSKWNVISFLDHKANSSALTGNNTQSHCLTKYSEEATEELVGGPAKGRSENKGWKWR